MLVNGKYELFTKVVPTKKTAGYNNMLEKSFHYEKAIKKNQPYLYITGYDIDFKAYMLNDIQSNHGDYFNEYDFHLYEEKKAKEGKKLDSKKPNILEHFKKITLTKKDFPKEKKSNIIPEKNTSLIPANALNEISKGYDFGAKQYGNDSWKHNKSFKKLYSNALLRHLFQRLILGEKVDKKTGLNHLALAGCCLMYLLEKDLTGKQKE